MKRRFSTAAVFLFAVTTLSSSPLSGNPDRSSNEGVRDRLIGAWRLVELDESGADGNVHRVECTGMLVFTREGRMSVQVMSLGPEAETTGPVQYSQGGYEASFGRYEIDEHALTFTYHVEGALVRGLIGKALTRLFELSDKQLVVRPSDSNEHWRVVWEHY